MSERCQGGVTINSTLLSLSGLFKKLPHKRLGKHKGILGGESGQGEHGTRRRSVTGGISSPACLFVRVKRS